MKESKDILQIAFELVIQFSISVAPCNREWEM